jgi:hypothetical protein
MSDDLTTLDYAEPSRDQRTRQRRRMWIAALVLSALAVGLVGRGLYGRLKSAIAARVEAVGAQRQVDQLAQIGQSFTYFIGDFVEGPTPSAASQAVGPAAVRFLAPHLSLPPLSSAIAITRMENSHRDSRVACVLIDFHSPYAFPDARVSLIVYVRKPASKLGDIPGAPVPNTLLLTRFGKLFQLDPPALDPNDARRLLLKGTIDNVPFAYELTLDANDRPALFALPAPTTRPTP